MTHIRELPIDADTLHKLNAQRRKLAVEHRDVDRLYRDQPPTRFSRRLSATRQPPHHIDLSWAATAVAFALIAIVGFLVATWDEPPAEVVSAKVVAERDAIVRGGK